MIGPCRVVKLKKLPESHRGLLAGFKQLGMLFMHIRFINRPLVCCLSW